MPAAQDGKGRKMDENGGLPDFFGKDDGQL